MGQLTVAERIQGAIEALGPLTAAELIAELDITPATWNGTRQKMLKRGHLRVCEWERGADSRAHWLAVYTTLPGRSKPKPKTSPAERSRTYRQRNPVLFRVARDLRQGSARTGCAMQAMVSQLGRAA